MKAFASIVGGLCVFEEGQQRHFVNVIDMSTVAPETTHLVCGAIDDWEVIDLPNREALLHEVGERHRRARVLTNIEACLTGVSARLQKELLVEVEDLLKVVDRSQLEAMLLRAPLASIDGLTVLIKECLSEGFASTASLLDKVCESQPVLRRLADRWLSIPDQLFAALPGGRQQTWRMAVANKVVLETLAASTVQAVERAWVNLAFGLETTAERAGINTVSKAVARTLFPDYAALRPDGLAMPKLEPEEYSDEYLQIPPKGQGAYDTYQRTLKQVGAIASAVADGHDARARQYLDDLVAAQMGFIRLMRAESYVARVV